MNEDTTKPKLLLDDEAAAIDFLGQAADAAQVALDTEFMRVRTYFPDLCLVQLARDDGVMACIDPLPMEASRLGGAMARLAGVVVLHSAGQDLEVLDHALGYLPGEMFDTQAAAALLGRGEQVSYQALVQSVLGVELAKGETRTDWRRRPLTPAQIDYAFDDVAYLLEIHQVLREELAASDKLYWHRRACEELLETARDQSGQGVVARFKGGGGLAPAAQVLLRDLVLWREGLAREFDRPREWVVSSADLVGIARQRPRNLREVERCTELSPAQLRRYGEAIVERVATAEAEVAGPPIWSSRDDVDATVRQKIKQVQAGVRRFCEEASISPTFVASRADFEALVLGRPGRLDGGWRRELLDDALKGLV